MSPTNRGFSLVELMVIIAIIAILASVAIPAYSNYVLRTRFQDEINKMDNYRKAIAVFIQEEGIISDEEFQSGIANVKDNYFGDESIAIISELKNNNGRLLAHPVINDVTYQIAVTPRINSNLVTWECNIRNETNNSAPPTAAMPVGCDSTASNLNDDQVAYNDAYDGLVNDKTTALNNALSDWTNARTTALTNDNEYQGYLSDKSDAQADYSTYNAQVISLNSDLSDINSQIATAQNNLNNSTSNAAIYRENAINEPDNASYWGDLATAADTAATNYQNELNSLNSQKTTIQNNITTAENNRTTAATNLSTANSNITTRYNEIDSATQVSSNYDSKVDTANNDFGTGLETLNNLDAFGQDHVTQKSS